MTILLEREDRAALRQASAKRVFHQEGAAVAVAPFLQLAGITKSFTSNGRRSVVVDDVSLDIQPAEFVCVLGPSGCGKTTLLRLIAGFERADAGSINQAGRDISSLAPESRDFGIVFQSYALFPNRSVVQNIAYGLEATGVHRELRSARVKELLTLVGLTAHSAKYPNQLSGGQQQRVALARALALSPGLLLLDEPLSALDANVRVSLRDELRALQRRLGITTLMVTHDQHEALSVADRIVVMNHGRIEQVGKPSDVYDRPANLFVARFLGPVNALQVDGIDAGFVHAGDMSFAVDVVEGAVGDRCLAIRPAAVAVGHQARSVANSFRARVTETVFLGDLMRITFQLPSIKAPILQAETHRTRLDVEPRVGDVLDVALPSRHCMLLSSGTEA